MTKNYKKYAVISSKNRFCAELETDSIKEAIQFAEKIAYNKDTSAVYITEKTGHTKTRKDGTYITYTDILSTVSIPDRKGIFLRNRENFKSDDRYHFYLVIDEKGKKWFV